MLERPRRTRVLVLPMEEAVLLSPPVRVGIAVDRLPPSRDRGEGHFSLSGKRKGPRWADSGGERGDRSLRPRGWPADTAGHEEGS